MSTWKEAADKYGTLNGVKKITLEGYAHRDHLAEAFEAGAEHGYDAGIARESLAWHREREQLKRQAVEREETNRQVSTALVHAYAEIEQFKQQLAEMTWEYENACKFATQFEQQRDKLKAEFKRAEDERIEWATRGERAEELCEQLKAEVADWRAKALDVEKHPVVVLMRADIEREREANAKLREALEIISKMSDGRKNGPWTIAKQALLAAKQDGVTK